MPEPPPPQTSSWPEFSTLWKKNFHTVENQARFFHAMEKSFPQCGNRREQACPALAGLRPARDRGTAGFTTKARRARRSDVRQIRPIRRMAVWVVPLSRVEKEHTTGAVCHGKGVEKGSVLYFNVLRIPFLWKGLQKPFLTFWKQNRLKNVLKSRIWACFGRFCSFWA